MPYPLLQIGVLDMRMLSSKALEVSNQYSSCTSIIIPTGDESSSEKNTPPGASTHLDMISGRLNLLIDRSGWHIPRVVDILFLGKNVF